MVEVSRGIGSRSAADLETINGPAAPKVCMVNNLIFHQFHVSLHLSEKD